MDRLSTLTRTLCLAAMLLPAATVAQQPYRPGIDVLDYAFIIDLPDTGSVIRGDAMVTVRRTARVDTLVLDLRQLRVTRVTLDGRCPSGR
jgi:aminopeptidase N